jgi:hypothetical protein
MPERADSTDYMITATQIAEACLNAAGQARTAGRQGEGRALDAARMIVLQLFQGQQDVMFRWYPTNGRYVGQPHNTIAVSLDCLK